MSNTNILTSLVQAELEMPTPKKDAVNPHFNSKYSTLQELLRCVKPALLRNGVRMKIDILSRENEVGARITLQHISGEVIENEPCWMPVQKGTPQGRASAITYASRYAICACFSIAGLESDDDGNLAEDEVKKSTLRVKKKNSKETVVCGAQTDLQLKQDDEIKRKNAHKRFMTWCKNNVTDDVRLKAINHVTGKDSSKELTIDEMKKVHAELINYVDRMIDKGAVFNE